MPALAGTVMANINVNTMVRNNIRFMILSIFSHKLPDADQVPMEHDEQFILNEGLQYCFTQPTPVDDFPQSLLENLP